LSSSLRPRPASGLRRPPLGTPTNLAVIKYVNQRRVPHLFLATGASMFGDYKAYPWTMGFQSP
jgi:hypothetical protein